MGRIRVSYYDVVGRALGPLPDTAVGAAVTKLSATYRAGRANFDFTTPAGQAAYAYHLLPAHVSDLSALFYDLPELLERPEVEVLSLGGGPGSEALALLEVISTRRARGELEELERVRVERVDHVGAWDTLFAQLLPAAKAAVGARRTGLGEEWRFEAPSAAIVADLAKPPASERLRAAAARADLIVASNLISEVAPRGTDELPAGLRDVWREVLGAAKAGAQVVIVDRAQAPGVSGRLAELAELARSAGARVEGPQGRETACPYALTRKVKAIYRHVHLPTTKHEDRPAKNCKTLWLRATFPED